VAISGKRVLVTGATGQVARPLAEALGLDNEVWAAARFTDSAARSALEARGIGTVVFHLGEPDLDHLPDVDYVIHCAVVADPATTEEAMSINANGAGFLMERYCDATAFFHMSSSSVYREKEDAEALYTESDELGGHTQYAPHYGMSKLVSEAVVRFQSRRLGLPAIMARLNVAYGVEGHGGLPSVLFGFMRGGVPLARVPGRRSVASPIHQDDIIEQVQALLGHAEVGAPVVNLAGDDVVAMDDMIDYIEDLTGLEMKIVDGDHELFAVQAADVTRRRALAGPCSVHWRDGIRSVLHARYPDALVGAADERDHPRQGR